MPLEPFASPRPTLRDIWRDLGGTQIANGIIGFVFSATGPLAIILTTGQKGGLTETQLASFVFGAFFLNSLFTLALTLLYRTPLAMFWTIPGTVLVGQALTHLSFPEVVGAFYATSTLILVLGLTGLARRVMDWMPLPIVMGMVAGVFLHFGLDIVHALHRDVTLAGTMLGVFLALSALPQVGRYLPPIIGALLAGILAVVLLGRGDMASIGELRLAAPVVTVPVFSFAALVELVVPLAITILLVQNSQGFAVLTQAGHRPPINAVTVACGIGGALSALVGAVGTCLTGPTNGILSSSGMREKQYTGALVVALLALLFGLAAPTFTRLMLAAPPELIMMLGGLAMLRVLLGAFMTAFKGPCGLGALTSFLVTVADIALFNVGAAFWGLVAGVIVSFLLERDAMRSSPPA